MKAFFFSLLLVGCLAVCLADQGTPVLRGSVENEIAVSNRALSEQVTEPFHCHSDKNCSYNGRCSDDRTRCICDSSYATHGAPEGIQCNYERKSQVSAFVLQFLFGIVCDAGRMYLDKYDTLFWVKLWTSTLAGIAAFLLVVVVLACLYSYTLSNSASETPLLGGAPRRRMSKENLGCCGTLAAVIIVLMCLSTVVWLIVDDVRYGLNFYSDGNGIKPTPW